MNKLQKRNLIQISKNDPFYFQTLLVKAHAIGEIANEELEEIQAQCLMLLATQTQVYTRGRSSSVKTEVAENILASVSYTIGFFLKSQEDADIALNIVKKQPLSLIFEHGNEMIKKEFEDAKMVYEAIKDNSICTTNIAYNDTIGSGIAMFFETYDADFAAHETPGSIDYLVKVPTELCGIEYISHYLMNLHIENSFCKRFSDIDSLLRGYSDDFEELLINIFDLVLMNTIGCTIVNKTNTLHLDTLDKQFLQQRFSNLSDAHLYKLIVNTVDELCNNLQVLNKAETTYIMASIPRLLPRLKNALAVNQINTVFVSCKQPIMQKNVFEDHPKMDDEQFRKITEEIRGCKSVNQKIAIIQQEINSFADLVDVLEASCIWEDEFADIFVVLDEFTISMLMDIVRNNVDDLHLSESEKIWQKKFLQLC